MSNPLFVLCFVRCSLYFVVWVSLRIWFRVYSSLCLVFDTHLVHLKCNDLEKYCACERYKNWIRAEVFSYGSRNIFYSVKGLSMGQVIQGQFSKEKHFVS